MEPWILFTIAAAFFQNLRNGLQKSLNSVLSTTGAAYTRFAFGLPFAIIYWFVLRSVIKDELNWSWAFWIYAFVGGLAQILAMMTLLRAFSIRGFAVGTAYAKTETLQTAIFTVILLGEVISGQALIAIFVSLIGVFMLSSAKSGTGLKDILFSWTQKAALFGLSSAALLGLAAVSYRGAALALEGRGALLPAAATLVVALTIQTTIVTGYLVFKEKGQLTVVWGNRNKAMLVGIAGMLGSVGWFTAMTLENAAHVRALRQIELVFTLLTSWLIFHERINKAEIGGTVFIVGGVLILLL
ncbi:MAG: drug/metabolite transporter (DMT)-like permease [Gammaproteobacteria bacterium]|jgi:drug/metabolite transporter (DMT)-like permease